MQESKNSGEDFLKGRGSQVNPNNKFSKHTVVTEHIEGIDEPLIQNHKTEIIYTHPKTFINKVDSPDIGLVYSMNPYQGCEHGCIYCYARNSHEYWGYSAGLDFEQKIIVKQGVIPALEKQLSNKNWEPFPIMLSGNTDCYQPIERKMKITRSILETCLKFKHPVGIITKNSLVTRDIDILSELAKLNLVHVMVSITGLTEETRLMLEPRTATYKGRLNTLKKLSDAGIPCGVMVAPIIPGLTNHEIPGVIEQAALHGATTAGYTIVRLNGAIGGIFKDWLYKCYPDRADKVWNQISEVHDGQVNDSRFGSRMRGEGKIAESINQLFKLARKKHMGNAPQFEYDLTLFDHRAGDSQLSLF
jgi:DNA repair photolyase